MNITTRTTIMAFRKYQRGAAAVELALILPILVTLMVFPIFYARCFWHYTVAQKAAQDAVRYLSQVPRAEMMATSFAASATNTALAIAQREMADIAPGLTYKLRVYCDDMDCGLVPGKAPETVHVFINFSMVDDIFGVVETGRYGLRITADARMSYVGM